MPNPPNRDASPEDILNSISLEMEATNQTSEELGRDKLKRASALAADTLIHMMLYSDDDRIRLRATQEVLDRVYGSGSNTNPFHDNTEAAYNQIFEKIAAASTN